jgi:hypothetical protein
MGVRSSARSPTPPMAPGGSKVRPASLAACQDHRSSLKTARPRSASSSARARTRSTPPHRPRAARTRGSLCPCRAGCCATSGAEHQADRLDDVVHQCLPLIRIGIYGGETPAVLSQLGLSHCRRSYNAARGLLEGGPSGQVGGVTGSEQPPTAGGRSFARRRGQHSRLDAASVMGRNPSHAAIQRLASSQRPAPVAVRPTSIPQTEERTFRRSTWITLAVWVEGGVTLGLVG